MFYLVLVKRKILMMLLVCDSYCGHNLCLIFKDPSMSHMLESLTNPTKKDQIEERMAKIKEDPSLKPILDEIESGGPSAMMK